MNQQNNQNEINVGVDVDVGKSQLDIYISPLGIYFSVSNDEEGIKHAIKQLKVHKPTRVIIEATGRLEQGFVMACAQANIPFVVSHPVKIKRFAGAIGRKVKTDKYDAELIAHYGEAIQPKSIDFKARTDASNK